MRQPPPPSSQRRSTPPPSLSWQAFTKDLEGRPLERLLRVVSELVRPSSSKAQIVGYAIATKFRHADPAQRRSILDTLDVTADSLPPGEQRER